MKVQGIIEAAEQRLAASMNLTRIDIVPTCLVAQTQVLIRWVCECIRSVFEVLMVAAADIVVHDFNDAPQLIVEAKRRAPASRDWAARMRRNLFAHSRLPCVPYFLLALPERLFLWKDASPLDPTLPDFEIDTQAVLQPYLAKLQTPLTELSKNGFETLIRSWLDDVINSQIDNAKLSPSEKWLVDSGLYDAIKRGSIKTENET